jgi:hypothetical protein
MHSNPTGAIIHIIMALQSRVGGGINIANAIGDPSSFVPIRHAQTAHFTAPRHPGISLPMNFKSIISFIRMPPTTIIIHNILPTIYPRCPPIPIVHRSQVIRTCAGDHLSHLNRLAMMIV